MKQKKGISLIVTVITIIVMIIISGAIILSLTNTNLIDMAEKAVNDFNETQVKEETNLDKYNELIINTVGDVGKANLNEIVLKNSTINGEMYSSINPIIPAGFKALNVDGENGSKWNGSKPEIHKGLVIEDEDKNQFVWVPVYDINDMVMCQKHGASVVLNKQTLQCPECKENTKLAGKAYATTVSTSYYNSENNFDSNMKNQTYNSNGLREPAIITGNSEYDVSHLTQILEGDYAKTQTLVSWQEQLQNEFDNMAKSVAKYGGFYVGRYEMSLSDKGTAESKSSKIHQTVNSGMNITQKERHIQMKLYKVL